MLEIFIMNIKGKINVQPVPQNLNLLYHPLHFVFSHSISTSDKYNCLFMFIFYCLSLLLLHKSIYFYIFFFSTDVFLAQKTVPTHLLNKWRNWDEISWQLRTTGTGYHNETISDPSITSDFHLLKKIIKKQRWLSLKFWFFNIFASIVLDIWYFHVLW